MANLGWQTFNGGKTETSQPNGGWSSFGGAEFKPTVQPAPSQGLLQKGVSAIQNKINSPTTQFQPNITRSPILVSLVNKSITGSPNPTVQKVQPTYQSTVPENPNIASQNTTNTMSNFLNPKIGPQATLPQQPMKVNSISDVLGTLFKGLLYGITQPTVAGEPTDLTNNGQSSAVVSKLTPQQVQTYNEQKTQRDIQGNNPDLATGLAAGAGDVATLFNPATIGLRAAGKIQNATTPEAKVSAGVEALTALLMRGAVGDKTALTSADEIINAAQKSQDPLVQRFLTNTFKAIPATLGIGAGFSLASGLQQNQNAKDVANTTVTGAIKFLPFALLGGAIHTALEPNVTLSSLEGRTITLTKDDIMAMQQGTDLSPLQKDIAANVPADVRVQAVKNGSISYTLPDKMTATITPSKLGSFLGQNEKTVGMPGSGTGTTSEVAPVQKLLNANNTTQTTTTSPKEVSLVKPTDQPLGINKSPIDITQKSPAPIDGTKCVGYACDLARKNPDLTLERAIPARNIEEATKMVQEGRLNVQQVGDNYPHIVAVDKTGNILQDPNIKVNPKERLFTQTEIINNAKKRNGVTSPLSNEAKQYYHGSSAEFDKFDTGKMTSGNLGKGIYLSDNRTAAQYYGDLSTQSANLKAGDFMSGFPEGKGKILNVNVDPNAKIKTLDKFPSKAEVEAIKKQGFDGINYPDATSYRNQEGIPVPKSRATVMFDDSKVSISPKVETPPITPKNIAEGAVEPKSEPTGTSKIAQSVNQKAIEQGLTKGYGDLAGYDKITIKDQAEKAANLLSNRDEALAVIRGEKPLPDNLRGTAAITAAEQHIKATGDTEMAQALANSPLVSETSRSAQELRLAAEREPDSITAKFQEIRKARLDAKGGEKKLASEVKAEKTKLVSLDKAENIKGSTQWAKLLDHLRC